MKVKVCGMREPENIRQVAGLSPDYMGFIFYPESKRFVGDTFTMPPDIGIVKKTGVFVNESYDHIVQKITAYNLDALQLHGEETGGFCARLKKHPVEVIKAFGIDKQFDFNSTEAYLDVTDFFLFDTKTAAHGGSGVSFDHHLLEKYPWKKPFFLSGGINPDNLNEILKMEDRRLYGVDLNSGFETKPGIKDINKLAKAINTIKSISFSAGGQRVYVQNK